MKKTEHLNYSRQAIPSIMATIERFKTLMEVVSMTKEERQIEEVYLLSLKAALSVLGQVEVFQLPEGGMFADDFDLKALDPIEKLHLPYKAMVIEYHMPTCEDELREDQVMSRKRILIVVEKDETIVIQSVFYSNDISDWGVQTPFEIPRVGYFDRSMSQNKDKVLNMAISIICRNELLSQGGEFAADAGVLLSLLNVLQCSNITTTISKGRKLSKKQKRNKALPFDSYHILTVKGYGSRTGNGTGSGKNHQGREKRTHFRRGHIRRLQTGKTIWVNACVINPDKGNFVDKTYNIKG